MGRMSRGASLVTQMVKNLPAMQGTPVQSLGWEDPLEKEMATHSCILAGEIHGQKSLAGHNPYGVAKSWTPLSKYTHTHTHTHTHHVLYSSSLLVIHFEYSSVYICSVIQSCSTFYDPMDCSTSGFPVLHHLPEFAHTHVRWVDDAIQPSHPLQCSVVLAQFCCESKIKKNTTMRKILTQKTVMSPC